MRGINARNVIIEKPNCLYASLGTAVSAHHQSACLHYGICHRNCPAPVTLLLLLLAVKDLCNESPKQALAKYVINDGLWRFGYRLGPAAEWSSFEWKRRVQSLQSVHTIRETMSCERAQWSAVTLQVTTHHPAHRLAARPAVVDANRACFANWSAKPLMSLPLCSHTARSIIAAKSKFHFRSRPLPVCEITALRKCNN